MTRTQRKSFGPGRLAASRNWSIWFVVTNIGVAALRVQESHEVFKLSSILQFSLGAVCLVAAVYFHLRIRRLKANDSSNSGGEL